MLHAIRVDPLRRRSRHSDAELVYAAAIALTVNTAEQAFLRRRQQEPHG